MAVDRRRIVHKRDRLRQLRAFCRVATMGNMTAAADSLGVTQPAVSLHVRELEQEVHAVLVDRSARRAALTPAGERMYTLAEPLVDGLERASGDLLKQLVESAPRRLRIAATPELASLVVGKRLRGFQDGDPGWRVRVETCNASEGVGRLREGEVDLVLVPGETETAEHRSLVYHHIGDFDMVLITAPDHALAGSEAVDPEEVARHAAIAPAPGLCDRHCEAVMRERFGFDASAVIEASGWDVVKQFVEEGMGLSIVPSVCLRTGDALSRVALGDHFPTRSFGVVTRENRPLAPPIQGLIQLVAQLAGVKAAREPHTRNRSPTRGAGSFPAAGTHRSHGRTQP